MSEKLFTKLSHYILVALLGLPLVYIPGAVNITMALRFGLLITLALSMVAFYCKPLLFSNFKALDRPTKYALGFLFLSMIASTAMFFSPWQVRIVGRDYEYQGILFWLSLVVIAIAVRNNVSSFFKNPLALYIGGLVCVISLALCITQVQDNLRLTGLIMQSTSMGFYGAFILCIALWNVFFATNKFNMLRTIGIVGIICAFLVVLLSQSRGAYYATALSLIIFTLWSYRNAQSKTVALAFITLFVALIPLLGGPLFARFIQDNVSESTNYRLTIYKSTFSENLSGLYLVGNGPGAVPHKINTREAVPKDIAETLDKGYIFISSHDIFLDFSYYFGIIAGAILLVLWFIKLGALVRFFDTYPLELCIFFAIGTNAFINIPSLELTPWFFILLLMSGKQLQISQKLLTKIHKRL